MEDPIAYHTEHEPEAPARRPHPDFCRIVNSDAGQLLLVIEDADDGDGDFGAYLTTTIYGYGVRLRNRGHFSTREAAARAMAGDWIKAAERMYASLTTGFADPA